MKPKKYILQVRLSDEEHAQLQQLATDAGMTMSELVRDHIGRIRVRNRQDERQRVAMLNRINANLNMIARWVNTWRGGAPAVEVVSHLMAIERAVLDLTRENKE
ncbi:ribbon-helix-helix protein, CopG family [Bacillus sp. seq1]|uniref:plasmid mobilization protein n=1 Tax=Bacillus TaxID=1386 RepID=UPI00148F7F73|nr:MULTISPECIES: ribbon-helix-helix protein, CopG family [Bacillus]MBE0184895.1 ribbon-helix-helix protein, CopG family [Bacillus subtilis]NOV04863.1 ribbon-helix-helix protein, CopG family [Bacillus sp. seq1]